VFGGYFGSFAQSPIHFAISVTNLTKSEREYFYKLPVGDLLSQTALQNKNVTWTEIKGLDHLVDALLGSTALPVLFPPNGTYFDGGVLLNQPITPAIQLREPDILYVVIPSSETLGRTGDILEIAQTLVSTWISSSLTSQLERLRLVNKIRENRDARKLPVCVIRPSQDPGQKFGVNLLSFGERVGDLVKDGAAAANERINRFRPSDTTEATWY
jgi:predicted acylesterase/phospholipase RssA